MLVKYLFKRLVPKSFLGFLHLIYAWYGAVKYDNPSDELMVIGVTGTSGKSSIIHFLRQVLESAGYKVGSLSTIDFYLAGEQKMNDQKMTMLGKMQIQKYLREMKDKGCQIAVIETTSEGYLQHRHCFINYDTIILTNLYPEHIQAHKGFENYKQAKLDIFKYVSQYQRKEKAKDRPKTCVVNVNNEYCKEFLQFDFGQKYVFARNDQEIFLSTKQIDKIGNRFFADEVAVEKNGIRFKIGEMGFNSKLFGEYNVMNLLAVIAIARSLDISWSVIQQAISELRPAPGRIEFIPEAEKCGFNVIVDYAFEPIALSALYDTAKLIEKKRIIHVCGSTGGGRDKSRREPIGRLIGEKADLVILTDEDPYDEDPQEIIDQVKQGVLAAGKKLGKDLFIVLDRCEAIFKAIDLAKQGDLILVTGKGSEQAMCIAGGKMIPWDDREIVRNALTSKNAMI